MSPLEQRRPALADGDAAAVSGSTPLQSASGWLRERDPQTLAIRSAALVILVYACIAVDGFGTVDNVKSLLQSVSLIGIAAVGTAFVTLSGNYFMLSVGASTAVSTIVFAKALSLGLPLALLITLGVGGVAGLVQGAAVGLMNTNPIVTTIAAASLILGVGQIVSGGLTVNASGSADLLNDTIFGDFLPVRVLVFFVVALAAHALMQMTRFGREVRLTGSNRDAAELAGIRVRRVIVLAFVLAAAAAALSGALLAAEASQGNLRLGATFDFDVIAAVLVGGVAVTGGRGSIIDAAFGAVFIGMVSNILIVSGQPYELQLLAKGGIVLLSIALAALASRRRR
ncbi:ABC transporter permease [Conexibacter sp. CPCC 206217]|uniref:ABC transporter permease n=1 Tax=Conexibacter sp. CPCC 206217 TaxID=3064574 RepID=UPI00271CFC9A|nr:ABC transporter permease [Conexibacter sp. CPCC 206217]MDO8211899.1 ABC transporter permease [Conexibacter sp. CPCC 206217]